MVKGRGGGDKGAGGGTAVWGGSAKKS